MNVEPSVLHGEIVSSNSLTHDQRARMLDLMAGNFTGIDIGRFENDLAEKPWTILLSDSRGDIAGFSTMDVMETVVDGRLVRAVYSGDTIIDSHHRMTTALPRAFLRFLACHTGMERDGSEWFWFYVCKGYRTYRFLPVFYRLFHPHPDWLVPDFERRVMDQLARVRFGDAYDSTAGVVRVPGDYALREGVGDITREKMEDPFIRFFAKNNPGWARGEELVCLAPLQKSNFLPKARKWLEKELTE